ncbi:MAG: GNAT family N-acetyltransferase [Clostridia bacterium]|nr:GNAT family N-acetyltransferase [Clostridia bacterium]
MTWYGWRICFGVPANFRNKETIALQCLDVANAAQFPTDFDDVFSHLFGNENYTICMAFDKNDQLGGFSIFAKLEDIDTLHLHGIVLHPRAQGQGLSSKMIQTVIENSNTTFLTAKTHNPRMFETLAKFACTSSDYYPNVEDINIPISIYELVSNNEFVNSADEYLIVRNAYPDEKISQTFRNNAISNVFKRLNTMDAQVIVVKVK